MSTMFQPPLPGNWNHEW